MTRLGFSGGTIGKDPRFQATRPVEIIRPTRATTSDHQLDISSTSHRPGETHARFGGRRICVRQYQHIFTQISEAQSTSSSFEEDKIEGEDQVGVLLKTMYGTRDASAKWKGKNSKVFEGADAKDGFFSLCLFLQEQTKLNA